MKDIKLRCPVCHAEVIKDLNIFNEKKNNILFCWNCTSIVSNKKKSIIDEYSIRRSSFFYGKDLQKSSKNREIKVNQKKRYLKKILGKTKIIDKIIDFGAGPGLTLEACQILGIKAIGIETNIDNVGFCIKKGFDIVKSDFNNFEVINHLIKDQNSLFLFNNSLIYNSNISSLLKNISKNCSINSYIAINDQNYLFNSENPINTLNSKKTSFIFSTDAIKKILVENGFRIIYTRNYTGSHYLVAKFENIKKNYEISLIKKIFYLCYVYLINLITPLMSIYKKLLINPIKKLSSYLKN